MAFQQAAFVSGEVRPKTRVHFSGYWRSFGRLTGDANTRLYTATGALMAGQGS